MATLLRIKNVTNPNQDPNADCIERLNHQVWVPNPNLPTEDGFVATDDVVEALATLGGKQWELYAWLREVRADILRLCRRACDLPRTAIRATRRRRHSINVVRSSTG